MQQLTINLWLIYLLDARRDVRIFKYSQSLTKKKETKFLHFPPRDTSPRGRRFQQFTSAHSLFDSYYSQEKIWSYFSSLKLKSPHKFSTLENCLFSSHLLFFSSKSQRKAQRMPKMFQRWAQCKPPACWTDQSASGPMLQGRQKMSFVSLSLFFLWIFITLITLKSSTGNCRAVFLSSCSPNHISGIE